MWVFLYSEYRSQRVCRKYTEDHVSRSLEPTT